MSRTRGLLRVGLSMAAGVLTAAAFDPWLVPWLAPAGVGGLVWAARGVSVRSAAVLGGSYGVGFMGPLLWWMWAALGPGAWAGLVLAQSGWFAATAVGFAVMRDLPWQPIWNASVWVAFEALRSSWPWGGLPWGNLGFASLDTPWEDLVPWVGTTGTSWFVVLLGAVAANGLRVRPGVRRSLLAAGVVIGLMATGPLLSWAWPAAPASGLVGVAVVQGGVPGDGTQVARYQREVTRRLLDETRRLAVRTSTGTEPAPELVLWPESATTVDPFTDAQAGAALRAAVDAVGVPVVAGSIVDGPTDRTAINQSIVWTPDGVGSRYTKQHLVPFGEFVPLRAVASRVSARVAQIPRDMLPGVDAEPLQVGTWRLAAALCFDVAYQEPLRSQVLDGADLVTVQTSNAMFVGTSQLEQQWTISRIRALETGRSVVVSSLNGISGAIAPDGSVIQQLPEGGPVSSVVEVPAATSLTPATTLGAWPTGIAGGLAVIGTVIAAVVGLAKRRRRDPTGGVAPSHGHATSGPGPGRRPMKRPRPSAAG